MKLFTIGASKVVEHLKKPCLTESGILPIFDIKELKTASDAEGEVAKNNTYCALLGDDPTITYSAFKAFARNNPGAGILVFNPHPAEEWVRKLINEKILDKNNVAIVGARSFSKEEKKFMDENRIKSYSMKEISFEGVREVADSVMSVARQWSKVYISINLSVLDPAFAPRTSTPEPGGMNTRDLIYLIQRLKMLRNIGMADVVGAHQDKDLHDITSKVAAKIITELS
jgi:agmatinase